MVKLDIPRPDWSSMTYTHREGGEYVLKAKVDEWFDNNVMPWQGVEIATVELEGNENDED